MKKVNWTGMVIFSIVVLLVFLVGVSLLGGWGYGGWGGIGPGMMGPGMMGGWGYSPFGWIGMIFMWLIPVSLVLVVVFGIVWLVRAIGGVGGSTLSATRTCPQLWSPLPRPTGTTARTADRPCPRFFSYYMHCVKIVRPKQLPSEANIIL